MLSSYSQTLCKHGTFFQQLEESKQLEKSMKRVDRMRKMTDELLYQCIPKAVARKLRNGTPAMETIHVCWPIARHKLTILNNESGLMCFGLIKFDQARKF